MFFKSDDGKPGPKKRVVPLLPLRDILVFPHMVSQLFVGRERSINALDAAMARDKDIFLAAQKNAKTNEPTPEDIFQVGTLGTIMQLGGGGESHNPWDTSLYPAPALDVYRTYARLHLDLHPLVWTLAQAAGRDGTPVTRPCAFVYPDAACDDAMTAVA